jgi:hypothetical protein
MQGIVDDCLLCARKHTRQAAVTYLEARKGHPEKWDTCLGHLAEAADALCSRFQDLAAYYREEYLSFEQDVNYRIDWDNLIAQLNVLFDREGLYYVKRSSSAETRSTESSA